MLRHTSRLLAPVLVAAGLAAQQDPDPAGSVAPKAAVTSPATITAETDVPPATPAARAGAPFLGGTVTPIHTAPADMGLEYGTWAAGSDYKASFHDGMTFVPYLGKDYPHNQPFHWKTTSVRIGNLELVTGKPRHSHEDLRYEYDLGGVVEAYDVLAEGLEQTFVISERPTTIGDLVVLGDVQTQLVADGIHGRHEAVIFRDAEGAQILSYGAATAIDATGAERPMRTSYEDGTFRLVLDGQWLQDATFPVTVDPLLGNVVLRIGPTAEAFDVDVVRDDERISENVWYCYSRAVSSTDDDLWVWRNDDDLAAVDTQAFTDITTSWSTDQGKIAVVGGANKAVCVFSRYFPSSSVRRIRWHTHDFADLSSSPNTSVGFTTPSSGEHDWRPDVGGTRGFSSGNHALLVWQNDDSSGSFSNTSTSVCQYALLDVSGTGQGSLGSRSTLHSGSTSDVERPTVNQTAEGGSSFSWVAGYQVYNNSITGDDWDVGIKRIDNSGSLTGARYLQATVATHKLGPTVEGSDGRYLVLYSTYGNLFKTVLIRGDNIETSRIDWPHGSASSTEPHPPTVLATSNDRRWTPGGLGHDTDTDSHWGATFHSSATDNYYFDSLGYRGRTLSVNTVYNGGTGDVPTVGGVSYNDDADQYVLVFGVDNATTSQPVIGDRFDYPATGVEQYYGTSCSPASINWQTSGAGGNDQLIGHEFTGVRVSSAPSPTLHFLVLGTGPLNQNLSATGGVGAGCYLNVANAYVLRSAFAASSSHFFKLSLPESLANPTKAFLQDWHLDATGSFFQSTRAVEVELNK